VKTLGLLRHAKSAWTDTDKRDFDRGLNERGRRGARIIGDAIRARAIAWDRVIASPAERVRQTLAAARLGSAVIWDERLYLADRETLFEVLRSMDDGAGAVLLAGHNPGLQELILALALPGDASRWREEVADKLPTASFAELALDIDSWTQCAPGCGRIVHLARPRDLDPALGPE
jgi:phosphohistidine phosphatase